MSGVSRDLLFQLWRNEATEKHVRGQAFSLWAATQREDDLDVLRNVAPSRELADSILKQRLIRGDRQAVAALIEKLHADENGHWWQYGRYVWSPALTHVLDEFLGKRSNQAKRVWGEAVEADWITPEIVMRLPALDAERLLLKHWDHLRFGSHFVQAALYVSTPPLLEAARAAIDECPQPARLFEHLSSQFGIRLKDHPGLGREFQVLVLSPYLDFLSPLDIGDLWTACNEHGWFTTRRRLLDGRLQPPFLQQMWDRSRAMSQLDKMVVDNRLRWIDHWVAEFLSIDVSWHEILGTLAGWLQSRRSPEALELVASAVEHKGTREDLCSLSFYDGIAEDAARQLVADTEFAVRRRTPR